MFGDRDDIGASDFSDCDTAICLVGSVKIDVVGPNTGSDSDFELLCLCEALSCEVAGVEAGQLGRVFELVVTGLTEW